MSSDPQRVSTLDWNGGTKLRAQACFAGQPPLPLLRVTFSWSHVLFQLIIRSSEDLTLVQSGEKGMA